MNIDGRLNPCPFCGSGAALENTSKPNHERHITAGCSNEECFAYLPHVYFAREADAIAAWNRRAALPTEAPEPVAGTHMPCNMCDGTGEYRTTSCPACNGSGSVFVPDDARPATVSSAVPVKVLTSAWLGYWPGAGSIDSLTRVTRSEHVAKRWAAEGAEVTELIKRSASPQDRGALEPLQNPQQLDRVAIIPNSVYLAARYSRAAELRDYRKQLIDAGFTVTSRWVDGGHELTKEGSTQAHHAERTRFAVEDEADCMSAATVISFTEEPRKTTTRGGRHVEFGMARASGKRLIVVGHRENVFHCLPGVEFHNDFASALRALIGDTK